MKRIEELLSKAHAPDNLRSFNLVKTEIERGRLVCFFGAGLSLVEEYRKWGYPFNWVAAKLQSHISDAKEALKANHGAESSKYKRLTDAENILTSLNLKSADDTGSSFYLKAGDKLQIIIKDTEEIFRKLGYGETEILTSFEQACHKSFRDVDIRRIDTPEYSPYEIPAIYFLPFLGAKLLTTNVDESFEKVCIDLGEYDNWKKFIVTHKMNVNEWEEYDHSIFYIHGHIQNIKSLIMTQNSYDDMYCHQGQVRGARQLLRAVAETKSILFIGASLQDDATVTILNDDKLTNADDDFLTDERHFVTIVQRDNPNKEFGIKDDPQITPCDKILFNFKMYDEISSILLQLIRETKSEWSNCSWAKPDITPGRISNQAIEVLNTSLDSNLTYQLISISKDDETNPPGLINFLYNHHSIYKHDNGLGWSICCISGRDFTLDGNSKHCAVHALHNFPLGDSIYIIYGIDNDFAESTLYAQHGDNIVKMIENWQKNFPKIRDENCDKEFCPRVRVILFPLRKSRMNKEQAENEEEIRVKEVVDKKNAMMDGVLSYIYNQLVQNGYNLTPDQKQDLMSFGFEKLMELLMALKRALSLSNEIERNNKVDMVFDEYLQSNDKTLQRTLNTEGDNFEQNLQ